MNYRCFLDDQPLSVLSAAVYPAPYNDVKRTEYVIAHGDGGQTMRIVSEKKVESAVIRPLSLGWTADVREDGLYIDLKKPANISVEINGGYDDALLVFYAPAREESVREGDPHVRYFAPGVHEAGVMDICEDNTTVYLAEGAYVHGKLNVHDCAGFTLCGRGVLSEEKYDADKPYGRCVDLIACRDVELRDVTLTHSVRWTCRVFGCDDVHIDNVKIIGYRGNNDGFDICGSRNVLVEHCFTRTWDDSLVIKAFDTGDLENVTCRACTLWNDFARPIEVGVELRADHVKNVLFDDIDVIHSPTGYPVMGIHHGDRALVSNITFRNIRIEDVPGAQLFDVRITNSVWNRDDRMGRIEGIHFENIELVGKPGIAYLPEMSRLQGYSEECDIRDVSFKNIRFLGKSVRSAEEMGLIVMDHVHDVRFESDPACPPLGHAATKVTVKTPFVWGEDGLYRGAVRVSAENHGDVPVNARIWLVVSPVNTASYDQEKRLLSLNAGESAAFDWDVTLPAGRYVLRVQSDDAAVEPGWMLTTLELKLNSAPVRYSFVNYYGDRLADVKLSVRDRHLLIASDALYRTDASMTVYSAMPAEEFDGEVKFTVEETDFGEAPAVLMGHHGLELAPQLRCPAEITYVFKNEPRVREIRKNVVSPNASGARCLSFADLGLDDDARSFWLELELKIPETAKYRYPYTLFHSVKPGEIAHMFAHVTLD